MDKEDQERIHQHLLEKANKICRRYASFGRKINELAERDPRAARMRLYIDLYNKADKESTEALARLGNHVMNMNRDEK